MGPAGPLDPLQGILGAGGCKNHWSTVAPLNHRAESSLEVFRRINLARVYMVRFARGSLTASLDRDGSDGISTSKITRKGPADDEQSRTLIISGFIHPSLILTD